MGWEGAPGPREGRLSGPMVGLHPDKTNVCPGLQLRGLGAQDAAGKTEHMAVVIELSPTHPRQGSFPGHR